MTTTPSLTGIGVTAAAGASLGARGAGAEVAGLRSAAGLAAAGLSATGLAAAALAAGLAAGPDPRGVAGAPTVVVRARVTFGFVVGGLDAAVG
jgi:hypothetical protein